MVSTALALPKVTVPGPLNLDQVVVSGPGSAVVGDRAVEVGSGRQGDRLVGAGIHARRLVGRVDGDDDVVEGAEGAVVGGETQGVGARGGEAGGGVDGVGVRRR